MLGKKWKRAKVIVETLKEPILAILAAILIGCFIISHTHVPTESMVPTIMPGDHLIVNRYPYYYRDPIRGEIVVFSLDKYNMIKRVIGVPGDTIDIINDQVLINGQLIDETSYLVENKKTYRFTNSVIKFPYTVPKDYYFVMGDNRSNSKDSRAFGAIPRQAIIAKAGFRIWPFNKMGWVR